MIDDELDTCGCCEGIAPRTPRYNRPGKPAIDYRLDTHGTFLQRMIARLPTQSIPDGRNAGSRSLCALTTRSTDDPTIAILDAWAFVADVLTFYQERIANECFLHTATERRSVLELASAIGYELKPGVAASTYLAFTLEDASGAPGHATIDKGTKVMSVPGQDEKPQTFETIEKIEAKVEWNALKPRMTEPKTPGFGAREVFYLEGVTTGLKTGDWLLFVGEERKQDHKSERWDFRQIKTVTTDPSAGHTKVTWDEGLGWELSGRRILPAQKNLHVHAFREYVSLFGYNAPDWRAMSDSVKKAYLGRDPTTSDTEWPGFNISSTDTIYLDAVYSQILQDSWLVLSIPEYQELYQVGAVAEDSRSDFMLTAKTTRVTLKGENLSRFDDKLRETAVFAQSELMEMAEAPITDPITDSSIMLDRMVDDLTSGQLLIVSGEEIESGELYSEVATLLKAELAGDATKIVFDSPLLHSYKRDTVTIYANVARATHGETVYEVLGSGSAAEAHQRFELKKPPLTYVSASTPSGTLSTLIVRVNALQWQEEPSLYGLDTRSQNYIVRIDDDGKTGLVFGDGKNGVRLPTGVENVTAVYRSGIGHDGEVGAGSLTILQTRPLGVRGVTNPLPASGAESPEKLLDARRNAPVTVLTLDRIVSLRDFENFARSFAGIGKAQASALKVGLSRIVHITVAAANGSKVEGELLKDLCDAIDLVRDPIEHVQVESFRLRTFSIEADVLVDPRYIPEDVLAQVEKALRNTFSFENRDFGQPVTAAEVLSLMHVVEGVVAVDLNKLELGPVSTTTRESGIPLPSKMRSMPRFSIFKFKPGIPQIRPSAGSVSPTAILPSERARVKGEDILPAELLLLNPAAEGVGLKELKT